MSKDEKDEIKVVDRRRFRDDGEEKEPKADAEPEEKRVETEEPVDRRPVQEADEAGTQGARLEKVDFITFVLSLSQTAFLSLGMSQNPETGGPGHVDLDAARWTIDALEMMQEKTKGNLTGEEERIFERILAELRMVYVQVASSTGAGQ